MTKIYPNTDAVIEVVVYDAEGAVIPLEQINYLSIRLYTCYEASAIDYYKEDIDASGNLAVPSQDLTKLPSGILKYKYQVNFIDPRFPDNAYDYADVLQTDCYLVNATPCDGRPAPQYSDQYVTKLWLAKHGLIDASTEAFVTEYELAAALEAFEAATGTQGEMGTQGYQGTQGLEGAQGEIGPQGLQGEMGPQGYEGPQGQPGQDGNPGQDGQPGPDGVQGPIGTQGEIGPQGVEGTQGVMGTQGYEGPQGQPGQDGQPGPDGAPGNPGLEGPMGAQGYPGAQGYSGAQGPMGTQGLEGAQGAQGDIGPVDREAIDASLNEIFGIVEEDEEVLAESLIAINGRLGTLDASVQAIENFLPGTQGLIGTQGEIGTQGAIGTQGYEGPQGQPGQDGNPGTDGLPGPDGNPGTQGDKGTQGDIGTQGVEGTQGAIGTQGYEGPQGFEGPQGQPGQDGNPGSDGNQGTQGDKGTQGDIGTQGYEGPQGYPGTQGEEGTRGAQGYQGTQGEQGSQGYPGPSTTELQNLTKVKVSNSNSEPLVLEWDNDDSYAIQAKDLSDNTVGSYEFPTGQSGVLALRSDFTSRDSSIAALDASVSALDSSIQQFGVFTSGSAGNYSIKAVNDSSVDATNDYAIALGKNTTASGKYTTALGCETTASGWYSQAENYRTTSIGAYSHAEGHNTVSNNYYEHAEGAYNKSTKTSSAFGDAGNTTFSHGIGTANNNRMNAFEVMENADFYIKGIGGYDGTNFSSAQPIQNVMVASTGVRNIVVCTQAEYDLLTPDASTFYIIQ